MRFTDVDRKMIGNAHHSMVSEAAAILAVAGAAPSTAGTLAFAGRRWLVGAIVAALLITAASIAIFRSTRPGGNTTSGGQYIGQKLGEGAAQVGKSVASLLGLRSPGEREQGALASLKHRRQPILHQRALPKVHPPLSSAPLAAVIAPPGSPEVIPAPANPLYNAVSGPPEAGVATAMGTPPLGVLPGGGGVLIGSPGTPGGPGIPTVPGGPTVPTTPGTPGTPGTSGVPEPGSWAMMLIGFVLMGGLVRFERRPALSAASS